VFPRDIICLRNISINTLHKVDDDDDDNDDNNDNDDDDDDNNNMVLRFGKGIWPHILQGCDANI